MKYRNRLKRIADLLEKIAAASLVVGLFQGDNKGFICAAAAFILSFVFTLED